MVGKTGNEIRSSMDDGKYASSERLMGEINFVDRDGESKSNVLSITKRMLFN